MTEPGGTARERLLPHHGSVARRSCRNGRRSRIHPSERTFRVIHEPAYQHAARGLARPGQSGCGGDHRRAHCVFRARRRRWSNTRRHYRKPAHDRRAFRGGNSARHLRTARDRPRADDIRNGRPQRRDGSSRPCPGQPHLCHRRAGALRSGSGQFARPEGPSGSGWVAQASPWLGLIAGGALAAFAYAKLGEAVIWAAVVFACLLAAASLLMPQPKSA